MESKMYKITVEKEEGNYQYPKLNFFNLLMIWSLKDPTH